VKRIAVLDYGSGNIASASRALARVGADVTVTADFDVALDADGLVVPGVGAFAACMTQIRAVRGDRIIGRRLAGGRPVLGVCVGMQVLFAYGDEHGEHSAGLGEWPGTVERLRAELVPHMGWNVIEPAAGSRLFAGIDPATRFYFVHSYAVRRWEMAGDGTGPLTPPLVSWSEHDGDRFVAAVENGALSATQFHPEKSGDAGAQLLTNWLDTV
jgi:glutamine amidotransferase